MLVYQYRSDITKIYAGVIIHGCNSKGVMGSGVAKALRDRWPNIYDVYSRSDRKMGSVTIVKVDNRRYVMNAITQEDFGRDGKCYVCYKSLAKALDKAMESAKALGYKSVHMPKIGAGLGGGDWESIEGLVLDCSNKHGLDVYIHILEDKL